MQFSDVEFFGPCQLGKQTHEVHKRVQRITSEKVLDLIHMDLMAPMQVESLRGKKYILVCVDDYSRYRLVEFLREKSDTFSVFRVLCLRLEVEKESRVKAIRSDHGREFENQEFIEICGGKGVRHEFSVPIIPK